MTKKINQKITALTPEQVTRRSKVYTLYGRKRIVESGVYAKDMVNNICLGWRDPHKDKAQELFLKCGIPKHISLPHLYSEDDKEIRLTMDEILERAG